MLKKLAILASFLFTTNQAVADDLHDKMLKVAIELPSWHHLQKKETLEQRNSRIETIVEAILLEVPSAKGFRGNDWFWSREDLALSTLNTLWWESGKFDLNVHVGTRRGDQGRSICLGQIMYGKENLAGVDLDSTRRCVRESMAHLITNQHRCLLKRHKPSKYTMAKIYAGYVTGHSCNAAFKMKVKKRGVVVKRVPIAWERAELFWKLRGKVTSHQL